MSSDPYERVPQVPAFRIASEDVLDGQPMPRRNTSESVGGENVSPQISWQGFPPETRSFFVTMYDAGMAGYLGPAPPKGHGRHRYYIAVQAVDVESLGLDKGASPAYLSFALICHTLARAVIVPWFEAAATRAA